MEEPSSFQSQTEDEDYMLEKTVGYLPLHHELDSGLGWTDGSFHQGELSGMETEEGLDECHAHQGGRSGRGRGGSPSSESFISSELSDSGFYSVSTAEFLRFQRLLEKRMRVYNSRLHHQGELQNLCMDGNKAHRELEAIPEALAMQPESEVAEVDVNSQRMVRVSSVQLRKSERPSLKRYSSSSGAIFSTCSSPTNQRRELMQRGAGMLRRSRTLHHRPVHVEQRRRASHPASPNYSSVTLNRYSRSFQQELMAEAVTDALYNTNYPTCDANRHPRHANYPPHHANQLIHPSHQAIYPTNHANYPVHSMHHANHPTHHANLPTHEASHHTNNANLQTLDANHHASHPTHHAHDANHHVHPTHHGSHPTHDASHHVHASHPTHDANHHVHPIHHTSHATHDANHHVHPTHHASHPTHDANHRVHASHPTHDANHHVHPTHHTSHPTHDTNHHVHPTRHTSHPTHDANHHTHSLCHANYPPHPNNSTLPPQHSLSIHATFPSRVVHHANATLPTQHAHQARCSRPTHAMSQPSLSSSNDDHHFAPPQQSYHHDNRGRSFTNKLSAGEECEKELKCDQERERLREKRFHTLAHTPSQSQEGNDTWPKPTNRHGPYSTLEGHKTTTASSEHKPPPAAANPRAVRNQLLRERAIRLADERSGGMSTDDETNVEICRAGRYWSRSERREQVLQKQRQKREALGGGANTSIGGVVIGEGGGYSTLMELSQRKLSRLRNRKLLDDWTTVEELLTHGTRLGAQDETVPIPNSLLTVTTV